MQHLRTQHHGAAVLKAVRSCLKPERKTVELHEPCFCGNEWAYVKECLDSNWVSSSGKYVDLFEKKLAEFTGVRHASVVVNGTAALHISLKMAGVDVGDEVVVPDLTFVATANAVTYCGAVPHFADSEKKTLGIDPLALNAYLKKITEVCNGICVNKITGRKIKALVAMHTFGHPVDLDPLLEVCDRYSLALIEDAAEALGSLYKKKHVGNFGKLSILSFNGNKTITTGGGGAILTNDEKLGVQIKHITTTAKLSHPWAISHDQIGYNYRMPNINAALGVAQIENIEEFLKLKRALALRYKDAFAGVSGVSFFEEPEFAKSNYWLNAIFMDKEFEHDRDEVLEYLNNNGIKARPAWTLMHKLPMYQNCPRMDVPVAEDIEARLINIPSSAFFGGSIKCFPN